MSSTEQPIKEIHVIINVSCSDAREGGPLYANAKRMVQEEYLKRGVLVEYARISTAGTFVTPFAIPGTSESLHGSVLADIKTIIHGKMQEHIKKCKEDGVKIKFFVNISTHGDASLKPGLEKSRSTDDITINPDSPYNCGMLGAAGVWKELMDLFPGDISKFLQTNHRFFGDPANFIQSISDLRDHANEQKKTVDESIQKDPRLANLDITVTAAVNNYVTHKYHRVDGLPDSGFIDDVYAFASHVLPGFPRDKIAPKGDRQQPLLGLIHTPFIANSKAIAVGDAVLERVLRSGTAYSPGQVFTISGSNVRDPYYGFDPYQEVGFFYSIKHLNVENYYLLASTKEKADHINDKVQQDPLMKFVADHFGVKMHVKPLESIRQATAIPSLNRQTRDLLKDGFKTFKPSSPVLMREPLRKIKA